MTPHRNSLVFSVVSAASILAFTVSFRGHPAKIPVDTGAPISCISADFCIRLFFPIVTRNRSLIYVANGSVVQTLGIFPISINNINFLLHILPGMATPFLLGWDTTSKLNATITPTGISFGYNTILSNTPKPIFPTSPYSY